VRRAVFPATAHYGRGGVLETPRTEPYYAKASLVLFEFEFAAITLVLLAGSLLGRMNIRAWMAFTPLWLLFSYTPSARSAYGAAASSTSGASSTTPADTSSTSPPALQASPPHTG